MLALGKERIRGLQTDCPASRMGKLSFGTLLFGLRYPIDKSGVSAGASGCHCQAACKSHPTGGSAWTATAKGSDPGSGGLMRLHFSICEADGVQKDHLTGTTHEAPCIAPGTW